MSKARIINFKPTPRPKSNIIPFLSVVLIGALIMSMCNRTATAQGKVNHSDTTKPKTFQYFMSSKLPEYTLMVSWDSLQRIIVPQMGKTMTVDQAEYWKETFFRNAFKVYGSFRVTDSVEIKTK